MSAMAAIVVAGAVEAAPIELKMNIFLPPQTPYVKRGFIPWI